MPLTKKIVKSRLDCILSSQWVSFTKPRRTRSVKLHADLILKLLGLHIAKIVSVIEEKYKHVVFEKTFVHLILK